MRTDQPETTMPTDPKEGTMPTRLVRVDWFRKKWPERWENVQRVLQSGGKVVVKILYQELREVAR